MNKHVVDALTQLYPAEWLLRYAPDFSAFLEESRGGIRDVADILWSALREHLLSKGEREMNRSQHASGFLAFSFLAALAAGVNLVMTVDDSPLIDAMRSHMGMCGPSRHYCSFERSFSLGPGLSCFGARVVWLIPAEDGLRVHGPFSAAAVPPLLGRPSRRVGSAASFLSFSLSLLRLQVRSAFTWRFNELILKLRTLQQ